ncbi:hypothetical protein GOBAR_AA07812 [Gossypium barbadense]|uniref:Uncharacterized protein n=1 Tax=Gossypium barbadense TaxID=3634 RepID=A0A2P5YB74_GOSBA|nr:hypothetical protein GOBAR_AA07812 [Gossypium barbadense]
MDQGENRLQYGNWLRVQLNGNGQNRGNWRNGVEIIESKVEANTETNEGKKRSGDESELMGLKEKEKIKVGEEDSESGSTIEKRHTRLMRDGEGRNRGKRERIRGGNGENVDESPAKVVRRKLKDFISPGKAVVGDQPRQEPWNSYVGTVVGLETLRQFGTLSNFSLLMI